MNEEEYIGTIININNKPWRVADKVLTREWKYTLSHEKIDGTYESMSLNESALEQIVKSGSKVLDSELK